MDRVADVLWHRLSGARLPTLTDLRSERGDVRPGRVVGNRGGLADRVDLHRLNPVDAAKHAVEGGLLTRPLQPEGLENDAFERRSVLRFGAVIVMVGVQLGLSLRLVIEGRNTLRHLTFYTMW